MRQRQRMDQSCYYHKPVVPPGQWFAQRDLRQDQLTLQILRILQRLWRDVDRIDARLTPYVMDVGGACY